MSSRRSRAEIQLALVMGPTTLDGFTEAQLKRGWTMFRSKLMPRHHYGRPTRPWGWWKFEAGEDQPRGFDAQTLRLAELGELRDDELAAVRERAYEARLRIGTGSEHISAKGHRYGAAARPRGRGALGAGGGGSEPSKVLRAADELAAAQPVPSVCLHAIPACTTADPVAVGVARVDEVAPRPSQDQIPARTFADQIAATGPCDAVVSRPSVEHVERAAAHEDVVARSSLQDALATAGSIMKSSPAPPSAQT
jgi:hypothetical protein